MVSPRGLSNFSLGDVNLAAIPSLCCRANTISDFELLFRSFIGVTRDSRQRELAVLYRNKHTQCLVAQTTRLTHPSTCPGNEQ